MMLVVVVFCGIASSSQSLHRFIHPDANSPVHECGITLFSHGMVDATAGTPELAVPIFQQFTLCTFFSEIAFYPADYVLLPGRAPPIAAA